MSFLEPAWSVLISNFTFIEGQSSPWICWNVLVTEKCHCCFDVRKWRFNIRYLLPQEEMASPNFLQSDNFLWTENRHLIRGERCCSLSQWKSTNKPAPYCPQGLQAPRNASYSLLSFTRPDSLSSKAVLGRSLLYLQHLCDRVATRNGSAIHGPSCRNWLSSGAPGSVQKGNKMSCLRWPP